MFQVVYLAGPTISNAKSLVNFKDIQSQAIDIHLNNQICLSVSRSVPNKHCIGNWPFNEFWVCSKTNFSPKSYVFFADNQIPLRVISSMEYKLNFIECQMKFTVAESAYPIIQKTWHLDKTGPNTSKTKFSVTFAVSLLLRPFGRSCCLV